MLALFGLAWCIQGLAFYLMRMPVPKHVDAPHENLPWQVIGTLWLGTGLCSIVFSMRRRQSDTVGFLAVSVMPLAYAGSYLVSFATWLLTGGEQGWPLGILGFAIYGVIVMALGVVASWPEPETVERRVRDE